MITINIYYIGEGKSARMFAEEMIESGVVSAIRSEDGNIGYDYFFPIDDPHTVLLIDKWRDQEAIDRHHASERMGRIAELRDKYNLHMRVERFVEDAEGVPERDQRFIKE